MTEYFPRRTPDEIKQQAQAQRQHFESLFTSQSEQLTFPTKKDIKTTPAELILDYGHTAILLGKVIAELMDFGVARLVQVGDPATKEVGYYSVLNIETLSDWFAQSFEVDSARHHILLLYLQLVPFVVHQPLEKQAAFFGQLEAVVRELRTETHTSIIRAIEQEVRQFTFPGYLLIDVAEEIQTAYAGTQAHLEEPEYFVSQEWRETLAALKEKVDDFFGEVRQREAFYLHRLMQAEKLYHSLATLLHQTETNQVLIEHNPDLETVMTIFQSTLAHVAAFLNQYDFVRLELEFENILQAYDLTESELKADAYPETLNAMTVARLQLDLRLKKMDKKIFT